MERFHLSQAFHISISSCVNNTIIVFYLSYLCTHPTGAAQDMLTQHHTPVDKANEPDKGSVFVSSDRNLCAL
jgi:hypothetical protein